MNAARMTADKRHFRQFVICADQPSTEGERIIRLTKIIITIIIIIKQFIRRSIIARVTARMPYNVRCSYSAKQLVSEVGT